MSDTGCTCEQRKTFIGCPAHDAAMRTPEQVEADILASRIIRQANRHLDGKAGGWEGHMDSLSDWAEVPA